MRFLYSSSCGARALLKFGIVQLCLLGFWGIPANLHAASVTLTWDASTESDIAGYLIYKRQLPSIDYGSPIFSGLPTNPSFPEITVANLTEGLSYGFFAIAYDFSGNYSVPSGEVEITIGVLGIGGGNANGGGPSASGDVVVWLGNGVQAPTTTGIITTAVPADWRIAGVGDLDGDGQDDLVWRNTATGDVSVWLGNGVQTPTTTGIITTAVPADWRIAGVGDLDGDGQDDLVWRNTATRDVSVWLGNGVQTPTTMSVISAGVSAVWSIVGVGDLNGDGKADFVWRNTTNGSVAVWLMDGLGAFTGGVVGGAPAEWEIKGVGDTNADGKADLVWRNTSNGSVAVWLMDGLGAFTGGVVSVVPAEWEIKGVGDTNADDKADLMWRNTTNGSVAVWLMDGLGAFTGGVVGGASANWEINGVGDLDGQGKADLVWRASTLR